MLNPNAEPYVCLYAYQTPDPYITIPSHYPYYPTPRPYYSHVGFHQLSFYKCSWYYPPSNPPSLNSLTTFEATTTSTCTSRFDCKSDVKPKLKVLPKEEKEPRRPKAQLPLRRHFPHRLESPRAAVPKSKVQLKDASSFDLNESETVCGGRTTVMIRNIPGRFTRKMLLELLDKHCAEENEKYQLSLSEYDFVYLPIDFKHRLNLGYAFVNFTTARAANMLYKAMNKSNWDSFGSKKICEITYASIQGKEALEGHFRKKNFKCDSEAYLPILLSPPRNGSTSRPTPSVVGILRGRFSYPRI
ncbi:hypothetical protein MRB53_015080 [Persea americana]|uniref:Uncharacterized protein n=1 Tax=Persea americana TaxID=3435 RepID=A0ACC2KCM7_PERAE|nr:hypothetical protein MRB53_015080 [Persea americana]